MFLMSVPNSFSYRFSSIASIRMRNVIFICTVFLITERERDRVREKLIRYVFMFALSVDRQ